jgi:hypothetical protein
MRVRLMRSDAAWLKQASLKNIPVLCRIFPVQILTVGLGFVFLSENPFELIKI